MYRLVQYYWYNNAVRYHIVATADTKDEINKKKLEVAKELNDADIETLEVIATKNINSLKDILKNIDIQVFQVLKD